MRFQFFRKHLYFYGLEKKLFFMIGAAGMLLVAILGGIVTVVSGSYLYDSNIRLLDSQTKQTADYFDNYMASMQNTANTLSRQRSVLSVIDGSVSGYDAYIAYRDAYEALKSMHDYDPNIETYLFATKRQYVMSSNSGDVTSDFSKYKTSEKDWYIELMKSDKTQQFIPNFIAPVSGWSEEFAFALTLRDIYDWGIQGFLVVAMPKNVFGTLHKENDYQISIWDNNGQPVYLSQGLLQVVGETELKKIGNGIALKQEIPNKSSDGGFYLSSCVSSQTGWKFISFYSNTNAQNSTKVLQLTVTLATVVCVCLLLLVAMIIARRTIGPVNRLIHAMHRVENDNFSKTIDIDGKDEVGALIETFNRLIVSVRSNQILRKRAEIDALQKQMDPHFLFNTLESIRVLSLTGDNKLVASMIEKLADVFRYNINREDVPITTIANEIKHVRNYVDIQQVRFSNRLRVRYEVDDEILSCTTLKFILQPIVENSIRHSMETMDDECCITITGHNVDGNIIITIMDDGTGIHPDRLERIKDVIFNSTKTDLPQDFGIGLKNIQERLRLFYGAEYGLTLESEEGEFTKITIKIPRV